MHNDNRLLLLRLGMRLYTVLLHNTNQSHHYAAKLDS